MRHPEVFLLPVLMVVDYYLTIAAAIQGAKKYGEHFKIEHYELNPQWREAIAARRWLNPRHLLYTALYSACVVWLVGFLEMPDELAEGVLGCLFVVFAVVIGRHLSNLLTFHRAAKWPQEIVGQVTMAHSFTLAMSAHQCLNVAVPLTIVAVFSPTPFVLGAAVGPWLLLLHNWRWIRRHRRAEAKRAEAIVRTPEVVPSSRHTPEAEV